jgi:hypothetical protein
MNGTSAQRGPAIAVSREDLSLIRDPTGRSGTSLRQHSADAFAEAGPRVRIPFPPAESLVRTEAGLYRHKGGRFLGIGRCVATARESDTKTTSAPFAVAASRVRPASKTRFLVRPRHEAGHRRGGASPRPT